MRFPLCALFLVSFGLVATAAQAQARLVVDNQSQRQLTVKVMNLAAGRETLHATITIRPFASQTVHFTETGDYFTKTMATLSGRDPIYQKGQPFRVYNGSGGHSVITLTISIVESAVPLITGGEEISREEFERNTSQRR